MILSFYCDDTGPYRAGAEAYETFLNYCQNHTRDGDAGIIVIGGLPNLLWAPLKISMGPHATDDRKVGDGRAGGREPALVSSVRTWDDVCRIMLP